MEKKLARNAAVDLRDGDALLVIDTINDLEFPGGEKVLPWAQKLAEKLAPFRDKADRHQIPVVYINDNFGHWHSSFHEVYRYCTRRGTRGSGCKEA